jgi:hypothetical protein
MVQSYKYSKADWSQLLLLTQAIINQLIVNLGFGKHSLDSKWFQDMYITTIFIDV